MALTTSNLVSRCKERFGDPSEAIVTTAEWTAYLNEGYQEVNASERNWPWNLDNGIFSVNTAAGTQAYAVNGSAELYSVNSVYNNTEDARVLPTEWGPAAFLDSFDPTETGEPRFYRMVGDQIYLYPIPDGVYSLTIEAVTPPADLTTSGSNPLWPDRFRRALVEYALSRAYTDDGNLEYAAEHRNRGDAIVMRMTDEFIGKPLIESYPGVVDNWNG